MKDRNPVKILFLGANARNTTRLKLGAEVREVRGALDQTGAGDRFQLDAEFAVRPEDLQELLQKHSPYVVHFSGHGSGSTGAEAGHRAQTPSRTGRDFLSSGGGDESAAQRDGGGLLLEDRDGGAVSVRPGVLTELLEIVQSQSPLCCVVLNACFTGSQAEAIAKHVDGVVGMKRAIDDNAAIAFATAFYRALARGKSIKAAFKLGCNEIGLRKLPDQDVPELYTRPEVNPDRVFVGKAFKLPWSFRLRQAAVVALGLSCVLAVAALVLPPACVPTARRDSSTIVVAGPWLFGSRGREARRALCEALGKERKQGEGLECMDLPLIGGGQESLRKRALDAGASLLIVASRDGTANLLPLGALAKHDLLSRSLPRMDASVAGSADELAPLLRSLAHISERGANVMPDRIRCPALRSGASRTPLVLSLFIRLYARNCGPLDTPGSELFDTCTRESPDGECWFAKYLYATAFPHALESEQYLAELQDRGPEHLKNAAALQSMHLGCKHGDLDKVAQTARKLSEHPSTCVRLAASFAAACLLAMRKEPRPEDEGWLRQVDTFADGQEARACGEPMLGEVLGERAFWRASAGRWKEAADDYKRANELVKYPGYVLNRTEALLHLGDTKEAFRVLESLEDTSLTARDRIHKALLTCIAEWSAGQIATLAEGRLVDLYHRDVMPGESAFTIPDDQVLRALLGCRQPGPECAYTILAKAKTSESEELLKKALNTARNASAAKSH